MIFGTPLRFMKNKVETQLHALGRVLLSPIVATLLTLFVAEPLSRSSKSIGPIVAIRHHLSQIVADPSLQWLVVLLLLIIFLILVLPEMLRGSRSSILCSRDSERQIGFRSDTSLRSGIIHFTTQCILYFVLIVTALYFVRYREESTEGNVVVLLASVNCGAIAYLWVTSSRQHQELIGRSDSRNVKPGHSQCTGVLRRRIGRMKAFLLFIPTLLATLTVAFGQESTFMYLGHVRWVGIWYNPNLYGTLMATGVILSFGYILFDRPKAFLESCCRGLSALSGCLCFLGLVLSYSRGAWLGSFLGLSFLTFAKVVLVAVEKRNKDVGSGWARLAIKIGPYIVLLGASLFLIAFWYFRFTDVPIVRRLFSIANSFDFSWRNRIYTWCGAAEMVTTRPLFGFGWVASEGVFDSNFNHWELSDTAAYRLNDFVCLAASYGLPVVSLFLFAIVLSIRNQCADTLNVAKAIIANNQCSFEIVSSAEAVSAGSGVEDWSDAVRGIGIACTFVGALFNLVVSFWFEGSFFLAPTAALFWCLIFLVQSFPLRVSFLEVRPKAQVSVTKSKKVWDWSRLLRVLCLCLAGYAAAFTLVLLFLRFCTVNRATLRVAEAFCIPKEAMASFVHLSTSGKWQLRRMGELIDTVRVSEYNRRLVQWKVNKELYYQFVLDDELGHGRRLSAKSRTALWFLFYPKIKGRASALDAVKSIKDYLKEPTGRRKSFRLLGSAEGELGLEKCGSGSDVEALAVAIHRAIGIPARVDRDGLAEFHDSFGWRYVF